jgi:hypothetical protein
MTYVAETACCRRSSWHIAKLAPTLFDGSAIPPIGYCAFPRAMSMTRRVAR